MSTERFSEETIRTALAESAEVSGDCPSEERFVLSGRGELSSEDEQEVVLHIAGCTACAVAWRVAREVAGERSAKVRPFVHSRRRIARPWIGLAAAAALLIVVIGSGILVFSPDEVTAPVYREQEDEILRNLVPEDRPLPRDECVLRWAPASDGAIYDVLVTDERMKTLSRGIGLDAPEFRVPEEALANVGQGGHLFWQVSARLPDGRRIESATFMVRLE
jgi:hypothetical protein